MMRAMENPARVSNGYKHKKNCPLIRENRRLSIQDVAEFS